MLEDIGEFLIHLLLPSGDNWRFWVTILITAFFCGLTFLCPFPHGLKIGINIVMGIAGIIFAFHWEKSQHP